MRSCARLPLANQSNSVRNAPVLMGQEMRPSVPNNTPHPLFFHKCLLVPTVGRAMARSGLRRCRRFHRLPKFRTVSFPQYGFKVGIRRASQSTRAYRRVDRFASALRASAFIAVILGLSRGRRALKHLRSSGLHALPKGPRSGRLLLSSHHRLIDPTVHSPSRRTFPV